MHCKNNIFYKNRGVINYFFIFFIPKKDSLFAKATFFRQPFFYLYDRYYKKNNIFVDYYLLFYIMLWSWRDYVGLKRICAI